MISVKTTAHVGPDGTLTLAVPTPCAKPMWKSCSSFSQSITAEHGWPPGFFESNCRRLAKMILIERGPQGEYEVARGTGLE